MPYRFEHGKVRIASPRLKDAGNAGTVRDPSVGRAPHGYFAHGNRIAEGRGWKAQIRRSLGAEVGDEGVDRLVRDAMALFAAELRALPADGPAVRSELAAMARRSVVAAFLQDEAVRKGLATPEGLELADAAMRHDAAASRHRNNAHVRAVAESKVKPVNATNPFLVPDDAEETT